MAEKHLIKKYANRKLYDTNTSRYITLNGISELVREGYDIEVVDRDTGADLTPLILSQIVLGEEKRGRARANGETNGVLREALALRAWRFNDDNCISRVISPGTRMASPGPGNGWRPTKCAGSPSSRPSARTSSLNSSRNGFTSFIFMRSGRPPTL